MLKQLAIVLALSTATVGVHAAGTYAGTVTNGHNGQGTGFTSTATVGGSQANTGSYGVNGYATMATRNAGDTYAHAGASVQPDGANSYTSGGSFSSGTSTSNIRGLGNGQTTGAVGNDFTSQANSNFKTWGDGFTESKHYGNW